MDIKVLALSIFLVFLSKGHSKKIPFQIVVAQDGSGNFTTIEKAIQIVPDNRQEKFYIKIKEGVYSENIVIGPKKTNIVLIGEGMDKTIISGNRSCGGGYETQNTATIVIQGNGSIVQGITFQNTAGPEMFQAVALSAQADNLTFYQCRFKGYQDTLNTAFGKQFFRECEVLGTIDFIFGDAAVVFQTCAILVRKPLPGQYLTITAQSRMTDGEKSGIIFQNCTVNATEHLRKSYDFKCYFGRPWNDYSRVVVLQSFIDSLIDPKGWIEWEGQIPVHPFCAEFNNRGPGANTSSRVTWSTMIISHKQASSFTVRRFLESGTWIPPNVPYYLDLL